MKITITKFGGGFQAQTGDYKVMAKTKPKVLRVLAEAMEKDEK